MSSDCKCRFSKIERERSPSPSSLLTLPHFYRRKSGGANALVTRCFPVTCCPRPMSPGTSLSDPARSMDEQNPCQIPARSGRLFSLVGVPAVPLLLLPHPAPFCPFRIRDSDFREILTNSRPTYSSSPERNAIIIIATEKRTIQSQNASFLNNVLRCYEAPFHRLNTLLRRS